jgi:hypothetical protein
VTGFIQQWAALHVVEVTIPSAIADLQVGSTGQTIARRSQGDACADFCGVAGIIFDLDPICVCCSTTWFC